MNRPNLMNDTLALLDECPTSMKKIASRTGVGYQWLYRMSAGRVSNPRVLLVQRVYDYLVDDRQYWNPLDIQRKKDKQAAKAA